MFVIRRRQMDALARDRLGRFRLRVLGHVDRVWPALVPKPSPLSAWVAQAVDAAHASGIHVERDVMVFVLAAIVLGPRCADDAAHPWAGEILGDPSLDGSTKAAVLAQRLAQHLGDGTVS